MTLKTVAFSLGTAFGFVLGWARLTDYDVIRDMLLLRRADVFLLMMSATLGDMLQQISGVSNEDVGAQILTLQTRMQASMQTTAMMYQLSLVKFI